MISFLIVSLLVTSSLSQTRKWKEEEETPEYWNEIARDELKVALEAQSLNQHIAKNVILFLGDGMGIPTITAGRILKGQERGSIGAEYELAMDSLPHAGLSKVYTIDKQVPDSAATGTAFLCGIKARYYTVGVNGKVILGNCSSSKGNEVDSVLVDSFNAGKSTGIVTTTRLNHATPSAAYAHAPHRYWYGDADLTEEAKRNGCKDIAHQFYDQSHMFTVALGGGRKYFQPNTTFDPEYPTQPNARLDGQDLIQKWKEGGAGGETRAYVWNKEQFDAADPVKTDRLLGIFEPSDMNYEVDRNKTNEPSIKEMTQKAIQMLQKNPKGYFLLVEGGRIDHGHHNANAHEALYDTVAFDDAIERALQMTSESDTLIVVTADHSHTMTQGGYADRGNSIFGFASELAHDQKPYTSLLYANGPSYIGNGTYEAVKLDPHAPVERENLTNVDTAARNFVQQAAVPVDSETHGGEDVAILARGPMAHLFHGVHQQNYIAHVMRYASCVGSDRGHCVGTLDDPVVDQARSQAFVTFLGLQLSTTDAIVGLYVQFVLLLVFSLLLVLTVALAMRSIRSKTT